MPNYICEACAFSSKIRSNYLVHLQTKKHLKNTRELEEAQTEPIIPKKIKKKVVKRKNNNPKCYSGQTMRGYFSGVSRNNNSDNLKFKSPVCESYPDYHSQNMFFKNLYEEERQNHIKNLEMLLGRVGNTTINHNTCTNIQNNTQNNVQINNFGQENLDMLTDNYMRKMVIYPYTAIPKMIKKIHFNDKFPENRNIRMLNKKDNKLQILNNNKWEYVNKKETLESLINDKNYQLDKFFEEHKESFENKYQHRFSGFQDKINKNDKNVNREINTDTELVFFNSM